MELLKWLSVADRFAKAYLDKRLEPLGLNSSQHMYLLKICRQPGISQDSLLETFYVHPSNIVRTVAALERKGFLSRRPSEQDKRTWRLFPTSEALSIEEKIQNACDETEKFLLNGLGKDAEAFCQWLRQVGVLAAGKAGIVRKEDEFDA